MEKIDIQKLLHDLDCTPWMEVAEKVNEIIDYLEGGVVIDATGKGKIIKS